MSGRRRPPPDRDFVLDRRTGADDVFVAAGFSGHGFKFSSVVGRLMADFCLDRAPKWDIGRFRLTPGRFSSACRVLSKN